ncbi:Ca2+:Cation Antiporter [Blattamonas nauphoetae]|uniref:Ca2+:Cation Antiporter n=1 Tax=Blattamonas nauphoetae TaxID=2049346 RepID=A0ABQ9X397_9EUKA|nr:Ca2+:Cation Antiporter [Blattamonas nauphoetae]
MGDHRFPSSMKFLLGGLFFIATLFLTTSQVGSESQASHSFSNEESQTPLANTTSTELLPDTCVIPSATAAEQCVFIKEHCKEVANSGIIPYMRLHYCFYNKNWLVAALLFGYLLFSFAYFVLVAVDNFLLPSLLEMSNALGLPDELAGVTLLALGNAAPDMFAQIRSAKSLGVEYAIGESIGASTFALSFVAGVVLLIRPLQSLHKGLWIRDLPWLLVLSGVYLLILVCRYVSLPIGMLMWILYFSYLFFCYATRNKVKDSPKEVEDKAESDQTQIVDDSNQTENVVSVDRSTLQGISRSEPSSDAHSPDYKQASRIRRLWRWFKGEVLPLVAGDMDMSKKPVYYYVWSKFWPWVFVSLNLPSLEYQNWFRLGANSFLLPWTLALLYVRSGDSPTKKEMKMRMLTAFSIATIYGLVFFCVSYVLNGKRKRRNKNGTDSVGEGKDAKEVSVKTLSIVNWFFRIVVFVYSLVAVNLYVSEMATIVATLTRIMHISGTFLASSLLVWTSALGDLTSNVLAAIQGHPLLALTACFSSPIAQSLIGLPLSFFARAFTPPFPVAVHLSINKSSMAFYGTFLAAVIVIGSVGFMRKKLGRVTGTVLICLYFIGVIAAWVISS